MPNSTQLLLQSAEMRKVIGITRLAFESMMRKRAHTALAIFRRQGSLTFSKGDYAT
jgi:hypothetical protein